VGGFQKEDIGTVQTRGVAHERRIAIAPKGFVMGAARKSANHFHCVHRHFPSANRGIGRVFFLIFTVGWRQQWKTSRKSIRNHSPPRPVLARANSPKAIPDAWLLCYVFEN
jgi:hypothetical protein